MFNPRGRECVQLHAEVGLEWPVVAVRLLAHRRRVWHTGVNEEPKVSSEGKELHTKATRAAIDLDYHPLLRLVLGVGVEWDDIRPEVLKEFGITHPSLLIKTDSNSPHASFGTTKLAHNLVRVLKHLHTNPLLVFCLCLRLELEILRGGFACDSAVSDHRGCEGRLTCVLANL